VDEPNCHNRRKWNGRNKLGEMLTKLRPEILDSANNIKPEAKQICDIAKGF